MRILGLALALSLVAALGSPGPAEAGPIKASWVEYGAHHTAVARVVTSNSSCPRLRVNGKPREMSVRARSEPPAFPSMVCQRRLGRKAKRITLAGRSLPAPDRRAQRIAIVGDTGCAIDGEYEPQACRDPSQWPFAAVADSIAAWHPDVVIHVGDYIYRDAPCDPGNTGCEGSPYGDNWKTWRAELFGPAAAALRAAPWVFSRGNHEECGRASSGWFRYLYQRRPPSTCRAYTAPFPVPLGRSQLLVMDTSGLGTDPTPYVGQFAQIDRLARPGSWFVAHDPMWGLAGSFDEPGTYSPVTTTLQEASGNRLPAGVELSVAGDVHLSEVIDFEGNRPSQLVAGHGGDLLDPGITEPLAGVDLAGVKIRAATVNEMYGFLTLRRVNGGWKMKNRATDGSVLDDCWVRNKHAVCTPRRLRGGA